jgi:flagellar hook assembly protein FlgD
LRNLAAALVLALVSAFGVSSPAAAAPTSSAKVVIVVGATHGATAGYRTNADAAYAEAIKYTSHVTKVYSPNATWPKVKAAVAGANIVIYFGHGNGWPSPYTYDPNYTTKDGMGLNADLNGDGKLSDYENKYYGEPSMAQLGLAPDAIVMLHNLCYASGNSEPGGTAPSLSVARQRIDNYAAGFIKGGARAVIADGHMGPEPYLAALFTTGQSIVDLWRSMPNYHGHELTYASVRTPGYTDYADPDSTSAGFYRSLVTRPTLTTTAVTGAVGDTGADPASLAVPGRAAVAIEGAPLMTSASGDTSAEGTLSLPAGTRLKLLSAGIPTSPESPKTILVEGLDDPTIDGYVLASDLTPKDSRAPVLLGSDAGAARFSPNADGRSDTQAVTGVFSESVAWTIRFRDADKHVLATRTGTGDEFTATWDGLVDGTTVPDGTYDWTVSGTDAWQNGTATGGGGIVIDTIAPQISGLSPAASTPSVFSPNADGVLDTAVTSATLSEAGSLLVRITDGADAVVRTMTVPAVAGSNSVTWNGRNSAGALVADGDYSIRLTGRDAAGNTGPSVTRQLTVVNLLGFVTTSLSIFYPQDLDQYANTNTLSFALTRPAHVTWTIRNAAGDVVVTHLADAAVGAGTQSWVFNGTDKNGVNLARGVFTSQVTATDGTVTISQSATFEMNAFSIKASATYARRGSRITITARSSEGLSTTARLYVYQPGMSVWSVPMSKIDPRSSTATITLKTGGSAGTVTFKVWGRDRDGRAQFTKLALPLR